MHYLQNKLRRLTARSGPALAMAAALCAGSPIHAQDAGAVHDALNGLLADVQHPLLKGTPIARERETVSAVYARQGYRFLWSGAGRVSRPAAGLLQTMRSAQIYGLRSTDYAVDALIGQADALAQQSTPDPRRWAAFDLALSSAAARFLTHLHSGRVQPRAAGFDLRQPRPPLAMETLLPKLAATNDVGKALAAVEPQFYHYRLLKEWLLRYRSLEADAALTRLPAFPGRSIEPGSTYTGAPALRRLLVALGDLSAANAHALAASDKLDPALVEAVARFQQRHGLDADGVLGRKTFAALTTPLSLRVRQIELTLERWRWLPEFTTPPIIVNIPQFHLYAFRSTQDRVADMLQMPVIVGQTYPRTRTPVFVGELKYVVFRPYWDVPRSILLRELLPEIRTRPGYLEKNNFEIVRGQGDDARPVEPTAQALAALEAGRLRLRQRPGPENALGLIKFMLPNEYNVYLHGTPARELFKKSQRTFSHGCIRVSDPPALAAHVLRDEPGEWIPEKIEAAMNGAPAQRVYLSHPITVLVLYGTALATEAGQIMFFDDIYGHDRRLAALLGPAETRERS